MSFNELLKELLKEMDKALAEEPECDHPGFKFDEDLHCYRCPKCGYRESA